MTFPAMGRVDAEQERQRLAALYSEMTEEQLRNVADAARLTDEALQALNGEITRRKLDIPISVSPPGTEGVELRELVTIRRFRGFPEAVLARGMLDSAGAESFLADDNIVRMDWFWSNGVGGIKLQVDRDNVEAAIEVLERPIPESFEIDGIGKFRQPRCPKCESVDTTFEELKLNKLIAYTSAYLGVPIPLHRKSWKCRACGHEWENAESEEIQGS
jgi:hypothetical protein